MQELGIDENWVIELLEELDAVSNTELRMKENELYLKKLAKRERKKAKLFV